MSANFLFFQHIYRELNSKEYALSKEDMKLDEGLLHLEDNLENSGIEWYHFDVLKGLYVFSFMELLFFGIFTTQI